MELLIPGLIIVALMVYASTRIKKTAAAAFEAETIETEDFVVNKPEGFLHVINGDPKFAFEAYSKGFGEDSADGFRQATATLTVQKGTTIDAAATAILIDREAADDELVSDISEVLDERQYRQIEIRRVDKGIELRDLYKIGQKDGDAFVFKITSLAETTGDIGRSVEGMLGSFEVKSHMSKIIGKVALAASVLFLSGHLFTASAQSVTGSIANGSVTRGAAAKATVVFSLPGGLHANSNRPGSEYAIPTTVRASGTGVKVGAVVYPRGKDRKFDFSEKTINVYEGRTAFTFIVTVPQTFKGSTVKLNVTVKYQACTNEVCYPPKSKQVTLTARVQ